MLGLDAVLLCPEYGLSTIHTAGMLLMNRSLLTRHLDQLESLSNSHAVEFLLQMFKGYMIHRVPPRY